MARENGNSISGGCFSKNEPINLPPSHGLVISCTSYQRPSGQGSCRAESELLPSDQTPPISVSVLAWLLSHLRAASSTRLCFPINLQALRFSSRPSTPGHPDQPPANSARPRNLTFPSSFAADKREGGRRSQAPIKTRRAFPVRGKLTAASSSKLRPATSGLPFFHRPPHSTERNRFWGAADPCAEYSPAGDSRVTPNTPPTASPHPARPELPSHVWVTNIGVVWYLR